MWLVWMNIFLHQIQKGDHSNCIIKHDVVALNLWPVAAFIFCLSDMTSLMCSPRFFWLTTSRRTQHPDVWEHGANPQKYSVQ